VFAGAVRETVFSRPDVIKRVSSEFVPVALKAALINNPPRGEGTLGIEGAYLAEIGRTKAAPQGIVAANKHGRVLAWALNFDDASQIPKFLDYVLEQNAKHPGPEPFDTPRFMRFPSTPMPSVPAIDNALPSVTQHEGGTDFCPAVPPKEKGTVVARVWGRRAKPDGGYFEDSTKQENYIEDVFDLSPEVQRQVWGAAQKGGGPDGFVLPDAFTRTLATYCYLGMLDVRPVAPPVPGHRAVANALALRARATGGTVGVDGYELWGTTDVESSVANRRGDGASYEHHVKLAWRGAMVMAGDRIVSLSLWAEGREKLRWGNPNMIERMGDNPAAHLPAGRALNFESDVVYGVIGAPVPDAQAWSGDGEAPGLGGRRGPRPGAGDGRELQPKLRRIHQLLGKLMRDGKGPAAAAALEELLRKLEALDEAKPAARDDGALARIERKMERMQQLMRERRAAGEAPGALGELMGKFGDLMGRGDMAGAERVLDQALTLATEKKQ
jgi:hypothetical protein